jgi:hypothetical protein
MLLPHFVPCQQDAISVRLFACTISVRAYPTAPTCKISMRRCAALRRPTCLKLFCTCKSHECGESASALQHSVLQLSEGRIATRTASVHERAAQISMAHRAGYACSSSCTSGLAAFVESLRMVRGARAAAFASAYAALHLQLGVRRSDCCAR